MTTARPFWELVADHIDPPPWEPPDRAPLEPHQTPPDGTWDLWILMGGRGSGKTEGSARYFARWMREHPGHRGRIIAPTLGDAVESCVRGSSGLMSQDPDVTFHPSAPGGASVRWPNGSEAIIIGTHSPQDVERFRAGGNRHIDWWEELAACRYLDEAWDQAEFGLRLGEHPHSIASTTPRNRKKLRELLAKPGTVVTRGTIDDNPHLTDEWKAKVKAAYEGTRIGRQELYGELLEDVPGALWTPEMLDEQRRQPGAERDPGIGGMERIVVAIDPAVTSTEESDETGIIVAAKGGDGRGYVLADRTCRESPDGWARRAVQAFHDHQADRIVAEANQGGDMVQHVIFTVDPNVPVTLVHATRGKKIRAEPIAALYEQGRVTHLGPFPELEDQMLTWTPESGESPDRVDALVWAFTALFPPRPDMVAAHTQDRRLSKGRRAR